MRRSLLPGVCLGGILLCPLMALATPWSEVRTPTPGPARVIGAASNGCIAGAATLPESGPGYISVRRFRHRYFGHPRLLRMISELGVAAQRHTGRLLMVGDLSQPRGGRMASSHRSHQNGLDVDLWLTLVDSPAQARALTAGREDPPDMVRADGMSVNARWGSDQRFLVETVARRPEVDRIFVNAAIKQALCQSVRGDRSWLRKVRPWWGHSAHMHVRLTCPPDSPSCQQQAPIPAGDGCDAQLAWWFSDEARHPSGSGKPKPAPQPPAACRAVLRE